MPFPLGVAPDPSANDIWGGGGGVFLSLRPPLPPQVPSTGRGYEVLHNGLCITIRAGVVVGGGAQPGGQVGVPTRVRGLGEDEGRASIIRVRIWILVRVGMVGEGQG